MSEAEKKANNMIADFGVYDWNENTGFEHNIKESKIQCIKIVNMILEDMQIRLGLDKEDYIFWQEVKQIITNK